MQVGPRFRLPEKQCSRSVVRVARARHGWHGSCSSPEHRKWDWSGADRSDGSGRARTIEFKPDAAPGSTKGDFPRTAPRLFPGRSQVQIRTPLRLEGPPEGRVVLGQRSAVGPGVVAAPGAAAVLRL